MIFVPGSLYSVNAATERAIPGLFVRNERVLCLFDTQRARWPWLVGALIVGSMETVWHGESATPRQITRWRYDASVRLTRRRARPLQRRLDGHRALRTRARALDGSIRTGRRFASDSGSASLT